jgi:hypothetical protein
MNDLQRQVIARTEAKIAEAMVPYHMRMDLYRYVNRLTDDQLERLHRLVARLTPDELDAALGYAEGLAAWSATEQESDDATLATEGTPIRAAGGPVGVGPVGVR